MTKPTATAPAVAAGPLSPFQEVYWRGERDAPGAATLFRAFEVTGPLDLSALTVALAALVDRHAALRTRFESVAGRPWQVVEPRLDPPLRVVRLEPVAGPAARAAEVERWVDGELRAPFDLGRAPLLRLTVLRRDADDHLLLLAVHHIICDGWSLRVLLTGLGEGYAAARAGRPPVTGPPPAGQLAFVTWQRQETTDRLAAARAHLSRLLTPPPRPVPLGPGPVDSYQSARRRFRLPTLTADQLTQAAARLRITPFIGLLAGFKAALWALCGQADLAVGAVFAGRVRSEFDTTVGLLANATVLRTDLDGDPTFQELAGRVRAGVLDAAGHQSVPIEVAAPAEVLRPAWSVWFNLLPAPTDELRLAGAQVSPRLPEPTVPYVKNPPAWEGDNLSVTTWLAGGEVRGHLDYNQRLLDPAAVDRLVVVFDSITGAGLADPTLRLSALRRRAVAPPVVPPVGSRVRR